MMFFLLKYAKPLFIGAVILAFIGAFTSVYYLGKHDGAHEISNRINEGRIKTLQERGKIDERLKTYNDSDRCRALGGVPKDNGECM